MSFAPARSAQPKSSVPPNVENMAKTIFITGANRGIGQQLARDMAAAGLDVLVGARDLQKGRAAATRIRRETGGRAKAIAIDVTNAMSVQSAFRIVADGAIRIDALVNNAGIYRCDDSDRVRRTFDTNFFGPHRVIEAALPLFADKASITNVTSGLGALDRLSDSDGRRLTAASLTVDGLLELVAEACAGREPVWGTDAYGASKAALNALTRIMAGSLRGRGISVNAVDPGWVRTDMGGRNAPLSVEEGAKGVRAAVEYEGTGHVLRGGVPLPQSF